MERAGLHPITVMRGELGPCPGVRLGNAIAYEFELDASFTPRSGLTRLERVYLLLDSGVQLSNPPYWQGPDATTWYVDLVTITEAGNTFIVRDLNIDAIIPTDGRHLRRLDLDEYAEALTLGTNTAYEATDGLIRWQRFLDTHLHADRFPTGDWVDFPPRAIAPLIELAAPLGERSP